MTCAFRRMGLTNITRPTVLKHRHQLQPVIFLFLISLTQTTICYENQTVSSFFYYCRETNFSQFQDLIANETNISITIQRCINIEFCESIPERLFTKASRLEQLSMNFRQGDPDICSSFRIGLSNNTFLGLESLQELYLEGFEKTVIDTGVFQPLRNLRTLRLVGFGSERLPYQDLSNAMKVFSGTPLQHIELNGVFSIYIKDYTMDIEQFFQIHNVSIKSLAFDNNIVPEIKGRVSKALPDLQIASFSVQFRYASAVSFIADMMIAVEHLEQLHIYSYPPEETSNIEYTKYVLKNLDDNIIHRLFKERDKSCHWNYRAPLSPNLRVLRLNGLRILDNRTFGGKLCFQEDNVLEELDLSGSPLPKKLPLITGLSKLTVLRARKTEIQSLSYDHLNFNPALKILDIGANDLQNYLASSNLTLSEGRHLEIVNFSQCNLRNIPKQVPTTEQLPLKVLDLSQNHLTGADILLDSYKNLTLLNISGNDIEKLSSSAMTQLKNATERNPNLVVDLTNNPLSCLCNSTTFVKWMQQLNHSQLHGYNEYLCLQPNGSRVPVSGVKTSDITNDCAVLKEIVPNATCPCDRSTLMNLTRIKAALIDYKCWNTNGKLVPLSSLDLDETLKQCFENVFTSPAFLVPIIVGLTLIIVTVTVLSVLYKVRKQKQIPFTVLGCFDQNCIVASLMALIYKTRETTKEFPYDAFMCFHDNDRYRICEKILSRLTNQENIVTPEDFEFGALKLEETERCIKQSRWIVFLMSRSFVNDGWCKDAVVRSIQRQHAVIPVILDRLELQDNHVISSLLRTNCPLNWAEEDGDETVEILQKKLNSDHSKKATA